jgi:hypothetical protein
MTALGVALKEWAAICLALAEGRQTLLLRKGGIAEPGGAFRVEHPRFWLMPTYVHQQEAGLADAYRDLLSRARAEQPPPGVVRLTHFAEVTAACHCGTLEQVLSLEGEHGWSREAVEARFRYRAPGLFVIAVRVYRAGREVELPMTPYLEGCKSWVELGREEPVGLAMPVLADGAFTTRCRPLDRLIAAARTSGG